MPIARTIRVVLYDRHLMCLESLTAGLNATKAVVASTMTVHDLPDIVAAHRPDICMVELSSPDRDVLAAISHIDRGSTPTRMIAIVEDLPVGFVRDAIAAGVRGFAPRDSSLRALNDTIDRVAAGQLSVGAAPLLRLRPGASRPPTQPLSVRHAARLTERESQVLDRLVAGEDTRHIAAALKISRSTARTHVQSIRLKLGAQTRLQAVAYAVGAPGASPRANGCATA